MHVVQIWIVLINALKMQLLHKNVKMNPKNPKKWHNTRVVLCWHEKHFESKKRQHILFRPPRWHVPYRNHQACCERSSGFREAYTHTWPKWDNIFTTACRCPSWYHVKFHEFQTSFQFTRMLKACISMLAAERQCQGVWHSFSFLACDLSLQPRTNIWFCTIRFYGLEHVFNFELCT